MVAILIMGLGFVFCWGGKVEMFIIDKRLNTLELRTTNMLCCSKRQIFNLKDVTNVRAIKKGHEGVNFYTLHYIIQAEFRGRRPVKILES